MTKDLCALSPQRCGGRCGGNPLLIQTRLKILSLLHTPPKRFALPFPLWGRHVLPTLKASDCCALGVAQNFDSFSPARALAAAGQVGNFRDAFQVGEEAHGRLELWLGWA